MMKVVDIHAIAALGKTHNTLVAVGNTFTAYLQPRFGADIVMHSYKYSLQVIAILLLDYWLVTDDILQLFHFIGELGWWRSRTMVVFGSQSISSSFEDAKTLRKWCYSCHSPQILQNKKSLLV